MKILACWTKQEEAQAALDGDTTTVLVKMVLKQALERSLLYSF
jgi:hypothetical protein|tara:strand:+ start:308 stop:436 length:129 start_codon:yes stop_codon:yes gene_type:complete